MGKVSLRALEILEILEMDEKGVAVMKLRGALDIINDSLHKTDGT